jgi:hypothetical protein
LDINEPLFFFTNKGPLTVDGYEYHVSRQSDRRYSSYIYMLFTQQDVDINLLDEYLDEAQQSQADEQLQAEQDLINQIFSDFTQGGGSGMNFGGGLSQLGSVNDTGHTTIDKFRVLVSVGSNLNRISDTSSQGFTVEYTDGDICNRETGKRFRSTIHYVCDPATDDHTDPKTPVFVNFNECEYEFLFPSQYACAQCRGD